MIHIANIFHNDDQSLNLSFQTNGKTIRLHSSRPYAEAQKMFQQLNPKSPNYFLGGLGCAYLLELILKENPRANCIVYEPVSPIFSTVVHQRPEINKLLDNPRVFFVQNLSDLEAVVSTINSSNIDFCIHRPYSEAFGSELLQAKKAIEQSIRKKEVGNATLIRFGKIWTKNIFRNMHRYFHTYKLKALKGSGSYKPAIIIGAGPSLAESIPYLKEAQDKAFLIACDTALPMMQAEGIKVDFVVTVDAQEKNAFYLRYSKNKDHILVADPSVHDSAFEGYHSDQVILMDSAFPIYQNFMSYWGSSGLLESGGSVSTSAFDLAVQMHCDPIIMVGQDLAFTQTQTHNKGHVLSELARTSHNRLNNFHTKQAQIISPSHCQLVPGRTENSFVLADARFILYRDWFIQQIPLCKASVIVTGLNGAKIDGAFHLSAEETFALLTESIEKTVPSQANEQHKQQYTQFLDELYKIVYKFLPRCRESLQIITHAKETGNFTLAKNESLKVQSLLQHKDNQKISPLVSVAIQNSIQKAMQISEQTSTGEQLNIIHEVCEEMYLGVVFLEKMLKKAQRLIGR